MKAPSPHLLAAVGVVTVLLLCLTAFLAALAPALTIVTLVVSAIALYYLANGLYAREEARRAIGDEPAGAEVAKARPTIALNDVIGVAGPRSPEGATRVHGRLLVPPEVALGRLGERLRGSGWSALLDDGAKGGHTVSLVPDALIARSPRSRRVWLNGVLLAVTFLSTTWAGAAHQGAHLLKDPALLLRGIPYSTALLLILGAHELGHFFAARRNGMDVSLPYFVPVPLGLGTFGAFVRLRSPSPSRKALFDMAVAGPLAGLALAVPALLVGLPLSKVVAPATVSSAASAGVNVGSSLMLAGLAKLSIGPSLTEAHTVVLHPLAFAGWLGLLLTALNLLPIGQLDGGHMADAMLVGRRRALVGTLSLVVLFGLGIFVWSGLLIWALIIYFIAGRKGLTAIDNVTPLDGRRRTLGVLTFALMLAIVLPVPHALYSALGIHCPYL